MGAHAWTVANALSGLAAANFTWSNGTTANRSFLNDGRMDKQMLIGASVASGVTLVVDLGSAQNLNGFAVLNSNECLQKSDAALRIRGADDAGISVNVVVAKNYSTLYSLTKPKNRDHVLQFSDLSKRYWELSWTWTGSVTNWSLGEIFAFVPVTQLNRRSIYGSGEQQDMLVALSEGQYGETRGLYLAGPIRALHLNWADLDSTARDQLQAMWQQANGGAKPLLWINSYENGSAAAAASEQECLFGRLTKPQFKWSETDFSLFTPDGFELRSLGREAGG